MPWDEELSALFADLERQAETMYDDERAAELADRSRAEYSAVTFASRLMASVDQEVTVEVSGVGAVSGRLARAGAGWCLIAAVAADWIVREAAVAAVHGASERSLPELAWSPVARLGLGSALRRLAEAGQPCVLHRLDGARHEGRLGRVGRDFAEVRPDVGRVVVVPFHLLAAASSREG